MERARCRPGMRDDKPSADAGAPDSRPRWPPRAIEAVWRIEAASVIAGVARLVRDVGLAEELAQDALVAALERWPASGVPDNPGAWLATTAKNRARDRLRLDALHSRKHEQIGRELQALEADVEPDFVDALDAARQDDIGDDLLRLIFTACHPLLSTEARVALTLRLLGGLSTAEIARAFLASESTIAQRIVRAKRSLSAARVPFEVPGGRARRAAGLGAGSDLPDLQRRLFRHVGREWTRPALCDEALRLGRILAQLAHGDSEAHGLVALMELQASRLAARADARGRPVLLMDQDRARWDLLLIRRGLAALARAASRWAARSARCRRRWRPARARAPGIPTGRASWRCTTRWSRPCPRRWRS